MRLSTERDRNAADGIAVLHAAFDAGITFFDTADAYCWDSSETGHNERLIATALDTWSGDRARIVIATKGGLTRPQGNWIEDGRARALVSACEASRRALGVERIQLYQLHAPDPRTPLSTSVRALAALRRDGLIEQIGLCNVNVAQIEEARQITEIASVQIELSVWHDGGLMSGVVQVLPRQRHPGDRPPSARRRPATTPDAFRCDARRSREAPRRDGLRDRARLADRPLERDPACSRRDSCGYREIARADPICRLHGRGPRDPGRALPRRASRCARPRERSLRNRSRASSC